MKSDKQETSKKTGVERPDKGLAINIINSANSLICDAEAVLSDVNDKHLAVEHLYKSIKDEMLKKTLNNIPIERLSEAGQGLRLGYIRSGGVNNVGKLLSMTEQQLLSIQGIGEHTARQVRAAANNIECSVRDNINVQFDPENHTITSSELIKTLFSIKMNKENAVICSNIMKEHGTKVTLAVKQAKLILSFIKWFISRRNTKLESIDALNSLSDYLNSNDALINPSCE
jgi:hypothetical protein